jgi:hypothetical protein
MENIGEFKMDNFFDSFFFFPFNWFIFFNDSISFLYIYYSMILNMYFHDNNKLFLFSFLNPSINRLLYTYLLMIIKNNLKFILNEVYHFENKKNENE